MKNDKNEIYEVIILPQFNSLDNSKLWKNRNNTIIGHIVCLPYTYYLIENAKSKRQRLNPN